MATQVQLRRGTSTQNDSFTGAQGELTFDTTNKRVRIHDGATAGGFELKTENAGGDTLFATNEKAIFGNGSDLQIFHDGSNSHIKDTGTGDLLIEGSDNIWLMQSGGAKVFLNTIDSNAINLYYNNSKKLETTNTGIDVTGTVTSDGLTVDGAASIGSSTAKTKFYSDSNYNGIYNGSSLTSDESIYMGGGTMFFYADGKKRLDIAADGDISFYEDTGTTAKFFWDASTERLGIGTSSPANKLEISGGTIRIINQSTGRITFNNGSTESFFGFNGAGLSVLDAGSLPLQIKTQGSNHISFATNNTEAMHITSSGNVGIGANGRLMSGYDSNSKTLTVYDPDGSANSGYLELGAVANNNGYNAGAITFVNNANSNNSAPENANSKMVAQIRAETVTSDNNAGDDAGSNLVIFTKPEAGGLAERMRIDSSGRLMLGTTTNGVSGAEQFTVASSGNTGITIRAGASSGSAIYMSDATSGSGEYAGYISYSHGSNAMTFASNSSERMRIDSSGNLLVGGTNTTPWSLSSGSGNAVIRPEGYAGFAATSAAIELNRIGSDGNIANFRKNGTNVGSIKARYDYTTLQIGSTGTGITGTSSHKILPSVNNARSDNTNDLGDSSYRWKDLYISGAVYLGGVGSANKLDDYEEGTWNLTDVSGAGLSLTVYVATYTKIGNQVFFEIGIVFPTTSNTSPIKLSLPFLVKNSADNTGGGAITTTSSGRTGDSVLALRNDTKLALSTNLNQNVLNSNFSGKQLRVAGQYTASA